MSDFVQGLVARALGVPAGVEPRVPLRFPPPGVEAEAAREEVPSEPAPTTPAVKQDLPRRRAKANTARTADARAASPRAAVASEPRTAVQRSGPRPPEEERARPSRPTAAEPRPREVRTPAARVEPDTVERRITPTRPVAEPSLLPSPRRASIEPRPPAAPRDLSGRVQSRVEVHIGRVEVRRAAPPPAAPAPGRAASALPPSRGFDELTAARRYVDRIRG